MKHINEMPAFVHKLAKVTATILCAVLFVCANTNSCCMIYQPEVPDDLWRFSKIQ